MAVSEMACSHSLVYILQAAIEDAVEPTVQKYLDSLLAEASSWQISALRQQALAVATSPAEETWVKQQLHDPTVALRKGQVIDARSFVGSLRNELEQIRQEQS